MKGLPDIELYSTEGRVDRIAFRSRRRCGRLVAEAANREQAVAEMGRKDKKRIARGGGGDDGEQSVRSRKLLVRAARVRLAWHLALFHEPIDHAELRLAADANGKAL